MAQHVSAPRAEGLRLAGTYRREVKASLARIWENVFDWEHLPSLHASSFAACTLIDRGRWGWRVRLVNQPGDPARANVLEMEADKARNRYLVVTLEGPGTGSEIRVQLTPRAAHETGVLVEFHVPETDPERLSRIGARYEQVYHHLWDEDEAMMRARERALRRRTKAPAIKRLGPEAAVRARAPFTVTYAGKPVRVAVLDGALIAFAAECPHWRGPLDETPLSADGCVTCPWHGYRFDVRSGASADGRGLHLAPAPALRIIDGVACLVPPEAGAALPV
jgi:nitrite reductase/ring-hydroxylating ferredoxin subunit